MSIITMEHVSLRREDNQILDDVHLHIEQGEHWVILGRNGSGKTTLLEMMNGYMFPSQGRIEVLGNLYGQCDVREVRKEIGYISQTLIEKLHPVIRYGKSSLQGLMLFCVFIRPFLMK